MNTSSPLCPQCQTPISPAFHGGMCPRCLMADVTWQNTPEQTLRLGPQPTLEQLGRALPQFEDWEEIGRGGMGFVFKASQPHLKRLVAIKILPISKETDPELATRFQREAITLASLNHPNIVTLHDSGQSENLLYLVMEYVEGSNLRELLRAGSLPYREALRLIPSLCEAVQFAHDRGVVHRDIKPENLLLDKQGRIKIADFGISRIIGEIKSGTLPGQTVDNMTGTPGYMAPEQSSPHLPTDHRVDIYALGVVLYEMLTGKRPGDPVTPPSKPLGLDMRLDDVILRALAISPEMRWCSAHDMGATIQLIGEIPREQTEKVSPAAPKFPPSNNWRTWTNILLFGLGSLCTLLFSWPHTSQTQLGEFISFYGPSPETGWIAEVRSATPGLHYGQLIPLNKSLPSWIVGILAPFFWILLIRNTLAKNAQGNFILRTGQLRGPLRIGAILISTGLFGLHLNLLMVALCYHFFGGGPPLVSTLIPLSGYFLGVLGLILRKPGEEQPATKSSTPKQPFGWSKKAIVGAVWIPFMILLMLSFVASKNDEKRLDTIPNPIPPTPNEQVRNSVANSTEVAFPVIVMILLFISTLIIPTLLGSFAIGDIKNAQGRLRGLRLAFLELLFLPVLLGLGVIGWVVGSTLGIVRDTITRGTSADKWNFWEKLIVYHETSVFICFFLIASFFFLRWVFRRTSGAIDGIRQSFKYSPPNENSATLGLIILGILVGFLILFVGGLYFLRSAAIESAAAEAAAMESAAVKATAAKSAAMKSTTNIIEPKVERRSISPMGNRGGS